MSVVWVETVPGAKEPPTNFRYFSIYVQHGEETQTFIADADRALGQVAQVADVLVGHQLSSDLAVLANASDRRLDNVDRLRDLWHRRRLESHPLVVDTRYDVNDVIRGRSRRLVDVCDELELGVVQPELHGISMTALHRAWLCEQNHTARERITILNLRHSLSTAYVGGYARGLWVKPQGLNANKVLYEQLTGTCEWVESDTFRALR